MTFYMSRKDFNAALGFEAIQGWVKWTFSKARGKPHNGKPILLQSSRPDQFIYLNCTLPFSYVHPADRDKLVLSDSFALLQTDRGADRYTTINIGNIIERSSPIEPDVVETLPTPVIGLRIFPDKRGDEVSVAVEFPCLPKSERTYLGINPYRIDSPNPDFRLADWDARERNTLPIVGNVIKAIHEGTPIDLIQLRDALLGIGYTQDHCISQPIARASKAAVRRAAPT